MAEHVYETGDRIVALGPTSNIATVRGDRGTVVEVYLTGYNDGYVMVAWDEPKVLIGSNDYRLVSFATFGEIKPYNPSWWARVWSWVFD